MGTLSQCSQREASLSYIEISVLFSNFPNFCMSQKAELPSLTGHRTKTRKRDEKQVNNPNGFRDSVIEGLVKAGLGGADITDPDIAVDLDAVFKFLDSAGNKFLKKSGLDGMLDQLFPTNKRTPENMKNVFITAEQPEIVTYLASLENAGAKKDIQRALRSSISDEKPTKEIILELKEAVKKNGLLEQEAVAMIWISLMTAVEWNKKEDLLQEQAMKHLKNYISLFSAFTSSAKSEMVLCNKIQEYCYDNQSFLKLFNKIILLFYKTEVLSEEVILKWYKDGHVPKGWTVFSDQMKKFIEWLEQAESEESEDESEDED